VIYKENDISDGIYFIMSGEIEITRSHKVQIQRYYPKKFDKQLNAK